MKILSPRDYLYIKDIRQIGSVEIGQVSFCRYDELDAYPTVEITEAVTPVFKILSEGNTFHLQAGFIDSDNNFFRCPITISYFSIDIINYNESTDSFETIIKAFNKSSKEFVLKKVYGRDGDTLPHSFENLVKILNLVNIYIDRGRNINEVFFENIKRKNLYYRNRNEVIGELVNNLSIQFFETGIYVPQKDNEFYRDVEIGNLPNNGHLLKILENSLLEKYKNVSRQDQKLLIHLEAERQALPSFPRRIIENTQGWEMHLKDNLKMDLAGCFDLVEYKLTKLFET